MGFEFKQCLVVRADLELSSGKWCAQVAHAAVSCVEKARYQKPLWYRKWLLEGQKKVVLVVENEEELRQLHNRSAELGIPTCEVVDMGLTEVAPNTLTCVGIGPAPEGILDKLTGNLPLF